MGGNHQPPAANRSPDVYFVPPVLALHLRRTDPPEGQGKGMAWFCYVVFDKNSHLFQKPLLFEKQAACEIGTLDTYVLFMSFLFGES